MTERGVLATTDHERVAFADPAEQAAGLRLAQLMLFTRQRAPSLALNSDEQAAMHGRIHGPSERQWLPADPVDQSCNLAEAVAFLGIDRVVRHAFASINAST